MSVCCVQLISKNDLYSSCKRTKFIFKNIICCRCKHLCKIYIYCYLSLVFVVAGFGYYSNCWESLLRNQLAIYFMNNSANFE